MIFNWSTARVPTATESTCLFMAVPLYTVCVPYAVLLFVRSTAVRTVLTTRSYLVNRGRFLFYIRIAGKVHHDLTKRCIQGQQGLAEEPAICICRMVTLYHRYHSVMAAGRQHAVSHTHPSELTEWAIASSGIANVIAIHVFFN